MNNVIIAQFYIRGLISYTESTRLLDELGYTSQEIGHIMQGIDRYLLMK